MANGLIAVQAPELVVAQGSGGLTREVSNVVDKLKSQKRQQQIQQLMQNTQTS